MMKAALVVLSLVLAAGCGAEPIEGLTDMDLADLEHDPALALPADQAPIPPTFTMAGTCPGPVTLTVTGATPGGTVRLLRSAVSAAGVIPVGPCAGTQIKLQAPVTASGPLTASGAGVVTVSATLGAGSCGWSALAIDVSTCTQSGLITL